MKKDRFQLEQCPHCTYPEPSRTNCRACFEQSCENGDITAEDIKAFGEAFLANVYKELGLEDELRFTEYMEKTQSSEQK